MRKALATLRETLAPLLRLMKPFPRVVKIPQITETRPSQALRFVATQDDVTWSCLLAVSVMVAVRRLLGTWKLTPDRHIRNARFRVPPETGYSVTAPPPHQSPPGLRT